ncbi:tripartite motif-containing protein 15-like isoform X2 [Python bivittatus]|uniref:Tripartite motif-containing protein 15-like isoform X2 n=1 Tax=Python bivittatus TaxID=176946 RepID=A0A9F5J8W9_PYTBI|nr:tripartite motif-containing protein 15-like isoform X2 [Python bivittatus]
MLTYRRETEQKVWEMLDLIKRERENTVAEFRELQRWLEEQEKLLLARMEETEKEIVARRDECLAKQVEELSSLDSLIEEMEEKHQQPSSKLLQDIGRILKKYQVKKPSENPVAFPLELKWRIWDYSDISVFLKGITKQFRDTLKGGLQLQKANVILDPETAHPGLAFSKDHKDVRAVVKDQCLPQNPKRFEIWRFILGCQGFSTGRHCWEITVGRYTKLPLTTDLKRIRVSLNCEGGQVTFSDAETAALLYTFSEAALAGETLLPSFFLNNYACLTLAP